MVLRIRSKLLPGSLIAVVVSAVVVWSLGWTNQQIDLISPLPHGLPRFHIPAVDWHEAETLLGGALALAIVGMLESVAIAKSIAVHTGEEINANQEFFAQGLKNFVSSFFQCIPGSGSFTPLGSRLRSGRRNPLCRRLQRVFRRDHFLADGRSGSLRSTQCAGRSTARNCVRTDRLALHASRYALEPRRCGRPFLHAPRGLHRAAAICRLVGRCHQPWLFLRTASRLHLNEIVPVEQNEAFAPICRRRPPPGFCFCNSKEIYFSEWPTSCGTVSPRS